MKKALLSSIIFGLTVLAVFAYETVIIKYPDEEGWQKAYYKKVGNEAIVQYLPIGQEINNWTKTIIVHSYNYNETPANYYISTDLLRMIKTNPTGKYKYLKVTPTDSIAGRCTEDYKNIKAQCEFYRVTIAHGGLVSIHYINRDKKDFMDNYHQWYDIVRKAKLYNSYYRDERTFDKTDYVEL